MTPDKQKSGEAETQMGRRWRFQARDSSDRAEATSGSGGSRALRPLLLQGTRQCVCTRAQCSAVQCRAGGCNHSKLEAPRRVCMLSEPECSPVIFAQWKTGFFFDTGSLQNLAGRAPVGAEPWGVEAGWLEDGGWRPEAGGTQAGVARPSAGTLTLEHAPESRLERWESRGSWGKKNGWAENPAKCSRQRSLEPLHCSRKRRRRLCCLGALLEW
ncbi:hypothetical protein V8C26DRAFT_258356 [Trichoderma gracile]